MFYKRHLIGIVVSSVILLLMYVAYAIISKEDIIVMVQEQIEKNFHQKVKFRNVEISVLPSLKAEIDDLALYQSGQKVVEVEKIILNLDIKTLMDKELAIESAEIVSPTVTISSDRDALQENRDSYQSFNLEKLRLLKRATVRDGTIVYDSRYRISKISSDLEITPQIIKIVKFKAIVGQNHLNTVAEGMIDLKEGSVALNIAAKSNTLGLLLQQFDVNVSDQNGSLEQFKFSGALKADRKKLLLKSAKITLDDTHMDFEAIIKDYNLSTMAFRTTIDTIDLNRYLPVDANSSNDTNESQVQTHSKSKIEMMQLTDIIKELRISNSVKIGSLKIKNYELSDIFLKGKIADGEIRIDPATLKIYDGKLEGSVVVNLQNSEPHLKIEYKIIQADIEQVFKQRKVPDLLSGRANLLSRVTTSGKTLDDLLENADADIALFGEDLLFKKYDIDATLEGFDKVTNFDMVDLAGVVAGPLGIVLINSYDAFEMKSTLDKGGQTKIVQLMASWKVKDRIAYARDVALKTPNNRIAVKGEIDIKNKRIRTLYIAILDKKGCAKYIQKLSGLDDGSIEVSDKMKILITPFRKLFETSEPCSVYYKGRVK